MSIKPTMQSVLSALEHSKSVIQSMRSLITQEATTADDSIDQQSEELTRRATKDVLPVIENQIKQIKSIVGTHEIRKVEDDESDKEVFQLALDALNRGRPQIQGVLVQQDQDYAIASLLAKLKEPKYV